MIILFNYKNITKISNKRHLFLEIKVIDDSKLQY
jgi:hypothetical protein